MGDHWNQEKQNRSIFIGGIGRSGTALTMQLLGMHREVALLVRHNLYIGTLFWNFQGCLTNAPFSENSTS